MQWVAYLVGIATKRGAVQGQGGMPAQSTISLTSLFLSLVGLTSYVDGGGWVVDNGGKWPSPYGRLNSADARVGPSAKRRVVAALIAHRTPCPDFRLTSALAHSRTERAAPLVLEPRKALRRLQVVQDGQCGAGRTKWTRVIQT